MNNSAIHLSSPSQRQKNIQLQHLQNPAGEGSCCFEKEHTLFISLAPRPIEYVQVQDGKTHTGLYQRGEILITPVNTPLFVRWKGIKCQLL
ncbi:MAG: hypothetical protein AAGE96_26095 [Cyanobacteria bacterium P01_G01_bin.19]